MIQYIQLDCPYCECDDLVKNGHSENGTQRYRCNACRRSFQWEYTYLARMPGVKEQIVEQTLNSSGVRDISRNLGIAKNTVIAELKKQDPPEVNDAFATQLNTCSSPVPLDVEICADLDEFWSYVGDKSNQRWTWYALDRNSGTILAHHTGKRTDAACATLMDKLTIFPIRYYYTDNWQSYSKLIPSAQHRIGKEHTWKIERMNLNFRTHLKRLHRKTICFSKNERIHDNVIGMYIDQYYYKTNGYAKIA